MPKCHLTDQTNRGWSSANGTKLQGVKSNFSKLRVLSPNNPKLQGCNLQFTLHFIS